MLLHDLIIRYIPGIVYTSDWKRINCPFCIYRGEPRPDRKKCGSYIFQPEGEVKYVCFRCKASFFWKPYVNLKKNDEEFLSLAGLNAEEIKKVKLEIIKNNFYNKDNTITGSSDKKETFVKYDLPSGSKRIKEVLNDNCKDKNFIDVCKYLLSRGDFFVSAYEYYWTPKGKFSRSLIIPFLYGNTIVGFTARFIDENAQPKYYMKRPKNYIFNSDILFSEQKYVFITEGPFDAIAVNGIAICGSNINDEQIRFLKRFDKEYIIVPDRMKTQTNFISVAERNGWWVSIIPSFHYDKKAIWEFDTKDCADAVRKYGRLYTIYSLLENKSKNYLKCKVIYNSLKEKES